MAIYSYISVDFNNKDFLRQVISDYAKKHNLIIEEEMDDDKSNRTHWENRLLSKLIKKCRTGDTIIAYEASNLSRSSAQILEILEILTLHRVNLTLVKHNLTFEAKQTIDSSLLIRFMQEIEADFVAKRTTEALARRREEGLPLGRPKGRTNKSLKLDKDRKEIQRYLDLGISKASIAKLIDCHAQTLYNYIEKRSLKGKVEA